MGGRADGDMVAVSPEADLVARLDAEFVAQFLGDHHLALGANPMSHTQQYNPSTTAPRGTQDGSTRG